MRILLAGTIENMSQTGSQRLRALQQIGYEATGVSIFEAQRESRGLAYIRRFVSQPIYERLLEPNARRASKIILDSADQLKPDIIWLEWPRMIPPSTLIELRKRHPNVIIASYQDDNPFGVRRFAKYSWQRFFDAIPYYDIHLVKRQSDVAEYMALGAKKVEVHQTGFSEDLYFPEPVAPETVCHPVIFVGTALDHRVGFLDRLTGELGVEVNIYGKRWERTPLYTNRKHLLHGFLSETGYRQSVCGAKIALGFVSHSNLDEYAGRTFEVPACGTLFLVERTPAQQEIYVEDKEVVFFDTLEECRDKIHYYLSHDEERERIAAGGLARSKEYGFRARMEEAIGVVKNSKQG